MKLDFLIFYEHASRELESDCYLAAILKKRGYRVKVINRRYLWRVFLNPKVIITPFLYGEKDVHEYNSFIRSKKRAMINLQFEQVLSDEDLSTEFYRLSEDARNAVHICWGENTRRRHMANGLKESQLPITGFISMDFNSPKLRSLLKSKDELAEEFGLDVGKKWHMFISSFVINSLSENEKQTLIKKLPGIGEFFDMQPAMQKEVMLWLKEMALKHPEQEFIYRPHPAEHKTQQVADFAKSAPNIHVIPDYSIRQWINICETSSTWYSTSIVDAFFAERSCCILRPTPIPEKYEVVVLKKATFVTNISEFDGFLNSEAPQVTPLNYDVLSDYYLTDTTKLFGEKLADACEAVLKGKNYPFQSGYRDCFSAFKYDVMAEIFRLFPLFGKKSDSRFHQFHVMAMDTRYDGPLLKLYMKRFNSFWKNGK